MTRRQPLVCQHLENISRAVLEEHQGVIRQYVRGRQGVYALYRRNRLYYVGLASNLRNRLKAHVRDRHGQSWDRFSVYLTIGDSHLKELESLVLRIMRPAGNKQIGRFARSENLRSRLARDINAFWREQVDEMLGREVRQAKKARCSAKPRAERSRQPVLAKHVTRAMRLRAKFKGQWLKARVARDGTIRFNGRAYTSPSLAGAVACRRRTCNGWAFWTYERAPGDWVLLKELRR